MRIVITGASSGIGAALARYYASEDSVLGLIARRPGKQTLKGKVTHYLVDVTDESALAAAAGTSLRASGHRTWSSPTPGFLPERAVRTSTTSPSSGVCWR